LCVTSISARYEFVATNLNHVHAYAVDFLVTFSSTVQRFESSFYNNRIYKYMKERPITATAAAAAAATRRSLSMKT